MNIVANDNTILREAREAVKQLRGKVASLEGINQELADQNKFLRHMAASQSRLVQLQMERIDLLERAVAPLGPLGQARLRRSAWWVRAWRRVASAIG